MDELRKELDIKKIKTNYKTNISNLKKLFSFLILFVFVLEMILILLFIIFISDYFATLVYQEITVIFLLFLSAVPVILLKIIILKVMETQVKKHCLKLRKINWRLLFNINVKKDSKIDFNYISIEKMCIFIKELKKLLKNKNRQIQINNEVVINFQKTTVSILYNNIFLNKEEQIFLLNIKINFDHLEEEEKKYFLDKKYWSKNNDISNTDIHAFELNIPLFEESEISRLLKENKFHYDKTLLDNCDTIYNIFGLIGQKEYTKKNYLNHYQEQIMENINIIENLLS